MAAIPLSFFLESRAPISEQNVIASDAEQRLLLRLAQLSGSAKPVGHFAGLYYQTTQSAIHFYQGEQPSTRHFICQLELRFAEFFFNAVESEGRNEPHWKPYFEHRHLSPIQYFLLGANAHINGDIWRSIVADFSECEIRNQVRSFLQYSEGLRPIFDRVYEAALQYSPGLRWLDRVSFGATRWYGFRMLRQWRKRQIMLALQYYSQPLLFKLRYRLLQLRMAWLNKVILNLL